MVIFNISSSLRHARAMHCFVNWLIWKHQKKNHLYDCAQGRRGSSTNWSLSRRTPGKEVALIWHHIMNMRATRRKIIIEMLKNFPKTIGFKCKMAPNDNIPVNIGDVLQKRVAVAWWTRLLWKSGIAGIVLLIYSQEMDLCWTGEWFYQGKRQSKAGQDKYNAV